MKACVQMLALRKGGCVNPCTAVAWLDGPLVLRPADVLGQRVQSQTQWQAEACFLQAVFEVVVHKLSVHGYMRTWSVCDIGCAEPSGDCYQQLLHSVVFAGRLGALCCVCAERLLLRRPVVIYVEDLSAFEAITYTHAPCAVLPSAYMLHVSVRHSLICRVFCGHTGLMNASMRLGQWSPPWRGGCFGRAAGC